jgi:hypothetical protein
MSGHLFASDLKIQTFGSAGMMATDVEQPTYYWDTNKDPDFYKHTKFGINFRGTLSHELSFSAQLLAKRWPTDSVDQYEVKLDYAQGKYTPLDGLSFYMGKIKLPVWLISDYFEVNALHPWITPPVELYIYSNGIPAFNGVMASYIQNFELLSLGVDIYYGDGNYVDDLTATYDISGKVKKLHGVVLTAEHENVLLRASYMRSKHTEATVVDTASSNSVVSSGNSDYTFTSLGLKADYAGAVLYSEYGKVDVKEKLTMTGYYATLGYDFGQLIPHITYASYTYHSKLENVVTENAFVKVYVPTFKSKQRTITAGLNFKASATSVFKIDYQRTNVPKSDKYFTSTSYVPTTTHTYSGGDLSTGLFSSRPDKCVNMINLAYQFYF